MFNLVTHIFGLKIVERSTICEGKIGQNIPTDDKPVEVWHKAFIFMIYMIPQKIVYWGRFMQTGTHAPVSVQEPG